MEYTFYKIVCNNPNINYVYIGSTKNYTKRKNMHKSDCELEKHKHLYKTIKENGGWENWTMSPIGKGIFENRIDARIEEQKYINNNQNVLNTLKAYASHEDVLKVKKKYRESHKEELKQKYLNNKELQEKRKVKTMCECGGTYSYCHKAQHFRSQKHVKYLNQ